MLFEDKSEFIYEDGRVTMSNGGVMGKQEAINKLKKK